MPNLIVALQANSAALSNLAIILQDSVSFFLGALTATAFVLAVGRF